jgi:hypothetical protein
VPTSWLKADQAGRPYEVAPYRGPKHCDEMELMPTLSEARREIEAAKGISQLSAPNTMSPAARLLWIKQTLRALELPTDFLQAAEAFRERASALRTEAVTASQQASQRRQQALGTLGRDQKATLAEAVAQWSAQAPWLDTQPGQQRPPALELAEAAARTIESGIVAQVFGRGERIFSLAARKAAEIVAEVAALPPMPKQLWGQRPGERACSIPRTPQHIRNVDFHASRLRTLPCARQYRSRHLTVMAKPASLQAHRAPPSGFAIGAPSWGTTLSPVRR